MNLNELDNNLEATASYQDIMVLMKHEYSNLSINEWTFAFQIVENYRTPPSICMTTHRLDWLQHYLENGYIEADPHLAHFLRTPKPLFWRADADWSSYGPNTVQLMKDALEWGYWGGVCVPIYTKEGTRGFFAFACDNHEEETVSKTVHSAFLARYFHHHIMRIWTKENPDHISLRARLSPREIEIMVGVTEGLTSQEVADKLSLSRRTVEGHIKSVQDKLQAENRQQALCKAINLGLLLPAAEKAPGNTLWFF